MKHTILSVAIITTLTGCLGVIGDVGDEDPLSTSDGGTGDGEIVDPRADCEGLCLGSTNVSRITRQLYANAVAQILGVTVDVGDLPTDYASGGFASNESVAIDPGDVDRYRRVAEDVAAEALSSGTIASECDAAGCAERFIADVGRRIYRRPLDEEEVAAYRALYESSEGSHLEGLRLVVEAMLQSPHFLYLWERGIETDTPGVARLTGLELAARLARFVWRSTPDDALLDAAIAGALDTPDGVRSHAERMLADPRADRAIGDFHVGWLGADLSNADIEDAAFDAALGAAMGEEVRRFATDVFRGDGSLQTVLTASWTVANPRLAEHYGLTHPTGSGWERIELPGERAGALTMGAFLGAHGTDSFSSAVYRGLAVRSRLLCQAMPDPPPEVADLIAMGLVEETEAGGDDRSDRERLDDLTADAPCSSCHSVINPPGYAFGHFDRLGRFQTTQRGHVIDPSGELVGTDVDGPFADAAGLAMRLSESDELARCTVRQWMRFALGRLDAPEDAGAIARLSTSFVDSGTQVPELLLEIVQTDAFLYRKMPRE
jgi:hypothetical protein